MVKTPPLVHNRRIETFGVIFELSDGDSPLLNALFQFVQLFDLGAMTKSFLLKDGVVGLNPILRSDANSKLPEESGDDN